jgi:hypothetical protein
MWDHSLLPIVPKVLEVQSIETKKLRIVKYWFSEIWQWISISKLYVKRVKKKRTKEGLDMCNHFKCCIKFLRSPKFKRNAIEVNYEILPMWNMIIDFTIFFVDKRAERWEKGEITIF